MKSTETTTEIIIGKLIGDVKVTRLLSDTVYYSKHFWQGDFRRNIRCKMDLAGFISVYPRLVNNNKKK